VSLVEAVDEYMDNVERLGLTDRNVASMDHPGGILVTLKSCLATCFLSLYIFIIAIICVPTLLAFLPMFIHINSVVAREMDKAVKGSTVKVKGFDVAASQKVLTAVVWFPMFVLAWTIITAIVFGVTWPAYAESVQTGNDVQQWWLEAVVWIAPLAVFFGITPYAYFATVLGSRAMMNFKNVKKHFLIIEGFGRDISRASNIRVQRKELALKIQDFFEAIIIPADPVWLADPIIKRSDIVRHRRESDQKRALIVASEIASMTSPSSTKEKSEHNERVRLSVAKLGTSAVMDALDRNDEDEDENEED